MDGLRDGQGSKGSGQAPLGETGEGFDDEDGSGCEDEDGVGCEDDD